MEINIAMVKNTIMLILETTIVIYICYKVVKLNKKSS